ncbi:hypothetical protein TNCV_4042081 [Trichonephila clavipes]|nr:hypothetical protein TNCV_4042081 [Trichonephila clavipes]
MRWLGHIWRSPENNQTRAYTFKNPMGSRTRGKRPTRKTRSRTFERETCEDGLSVTFTCLAHFDSGLKKHLTYNALLKKKNQDKHHQEVGREEVTRVPVLLRCSGKIPKSKFLDQFHFVRAEVPPSKEGAGRHNFIGAIGIHLYGAELKSDTFLGEYTRSAVVIANPRPHLKQQYI